jgi:hypothetical protein
MTPSSDLSVVTTRKCRGLRISHSHNVPHSLFSRAVNQPTTLRPEVGRQRGPMYLGQWLRGLEQ